MSIKSKEACSPMKLSQINPENVHDAKQSTYKKLVDANEKYLIDKVRVCEIKKPSKYSHKMPSTTGCSEYNRNYSVGKPINIMESTPQRNTMNLSQPRQNVTGYETTYHAEYLSAAKEKEAFKESKKMDRSELMPGERNKRKYERSDAPTFADTSYKQAYHWNSQPPVQSAKLKESKLMGEGKFNGDTTYHRNYRVKTENIEKSKPIKHKNNKIFMEIEMKDESIYHTSFENRTKNFKPEASCKPRAKYEKDARKIKYQTEYCGQYSGGEMTKKADFSCMSNQELKKFVLDVITE